MVVWIITLAEDFVVCFVIPLWVIQTMSRIKVLFSKYSYFHLPSQNSG